LCIAIGAAILNFLILLSGAFDLGEIAYLFVGVPVISLLAAVVLFVFAKRKKRAPSLPVFLSFPVYWVVSCVFFANMQAVRDHARWVLGSRGYEAELLAQAEPASGELRHIEWDGWGFAGSETNEYLVFDPSDSLASAVRKRPAGKLGGIPCEVPQVRRLERYWYSVEFYSNSSWEQCT
jgi:hypothetical protein